MKHTMLTLLLAISNFHELLGHQSTSASNANKLVSIPTWVNSRPDTKYEPVPLIKPDIRFKKSPSDQPADHRRPQHRFLDFLGGDDEEQKDSLPSTTEKSFIDSFLDGFGNDNSKDESDSDEDSEDSDDHEDDDEDDDDERDEENEEDEEGDEDASESRDSFESPNSIGGNTTVNLGQKKRKLTKAEKALRQIRRRYVRTHKFIFPLLLAYKLKFFTMVPLLVGSLILLVSTTGIAGFFFALFAAAMGIHRKHL